MFHASLYKTPHGTMLFATDEELLGKAFYDEERQIALIISENIYGKKLVDEAEMTRLLLETEILVLAGEKIVNLAIRLGLVHPDAVLYVKGVPHAHVYKLTG